MHLFTLDRLPLLIGILSKRWKWNYDKKEKKNVIRHLKETGKEIVTISEDQMHNFAGNMLELQGEKGPVLVMSEQAKNSLNEEQFVKLEKYCYLLAVNLTTIETLGGGSARCMLAEVF